MKRIITGIILLCLCFMVLDYSFTTDFTSSIIPGWNTTIPSDFWGISFTLPWIVFVTLTYFIFLKKVTSSRYRNEYLYMTVPFLVVILIASFIVRTILNQSLSLIGWTPVLMITFPFFILAQIKFVIKLISYTIKKPQ